MAALHLVSVIVPCYNQARYLDESLQSVLDQTYPNWECIIVNDGSPDNTEEIALRWTKKDARFRYLKKENGGLSSARNAGIDLAKGEWLQFLDCDDEISREKFEKSRKYFGEYDLVISDFSYLDKRKFSPTKESFISEKLGFKEIILNWDVRYSIPIHCAVFRKSLTDVFNEDLKAKEDWIFWIEFFKKEPHYFIINECLAYYRLHEWSMTQDWKQMLRNEELAIQYVLDHFELTREITNQFFNNRLKSKNDTLIALHDSWIKLNSKRYRFIDQVLAIFGK